MLLCTLRALPGAVHISAFAVLTAGAGSPCVAVLLNEDFVGRLNLPCSSTCNARRYIKKLL